MTMILIMLKEPSGYTITISVITIFILNAFVCLYASLKNIVAHIDCTIQQAEAHVIITYMSPDRKLLMYGDTIRTLLMRCNFIMNSRTSTPGINLFKCDINP